MDGALALVSPKPLGLVLRVTKYGDMLTISPPSTRSAQRSFWKLIDKARETRLELLDVELMSKPT